MNAQHTPGPWTVPHFASFGTGCDCGHIFAEGQHGMGSIATVCFGGENEPRERAEANARLIAKAPDLLTALAEATGSLAACSQAMKSLGNTKTAAAIDVIVERCMRLMAQAATGAAQ